MKILTTRAYIDKRAKLIDSGLSFEEAKEKLDKKFTTKKRLANN